MNPLNTYRQRSTVGWTRVDMLLALYDEAIHCLEAARHANQQPDTDTEATQHLLRALRIVNELKAGINPQYGDIATNLEQLCNFVMACLLQKTPDHLDSAHQILSTLRDAFLNIREEAVEMEARGDIPKLNVSRSIEMTA